MRWLLVLLAACGNTAAPATVDFASAPATVKDKVDFLFVLDDSRSTTALPALLARLDGIAADGHLGVVTSDLGAGPTPNGYS